jgi:hypothetical protein
MDQPATRVPQTPSMVFFFFFYYLFYGSWAVQRLVAPDSKLSLKRICFQ